ncbi:MAG: hypothetical protein SOW56_06865 [Bacteroidaceae bacterium]|nr:hypothetical protein [Bacteroidaceae bacterium]
MRVPIQALHTEISVFDIITRNKAQSQILKCKDNAFVSKSVLKTHKDTSLCHTEITFTITTTTAATSNGSLITT